MKLFSPESQSVFISVETVARPRSLEGLRIGLLDNTKAPVDKMMAHLDGRLRERIPGASVFYISKKSMALPASAEVMKQLRENADVVINALGD